MLFDKLAKAVEGGPLESVVEAARLFVLDCHATEAYGVFDDDFFLPFSTTAIEDKDSVIILKDTVANQTGLGERKFIECIVIDGDAVILWGSFKILEVQDTKFLIEGGLAGWSLDDNPPSAINKEALRNVSAALAEVAFIMNRERFILERSGTGTKRKGVRREHQRPMYTALRPSEIRSKLGIPTGKSVGAHERRAHWRRLKGRRIRVKACWVGPSSATVAGKVYKVIL